MTDKMSDKIMLGVTALIVKDNHVLLGLKGRAVDKAFVGKWVTPGGRVNFREGLFEALYREVLEETGLVVMIKRSLTPRELIHPSGHFVFCVYEVDVLMGTLKAGDDLEEVMWFTRNSIQAVKASMTPITRMIVEEWLGRD